MNRKDPGLNAGSFRDLDRFGWANLWEQYPHLSLHIMKRLRRDGSRGDFRIALKIELQAFHDSPIEVASRSRQFREKFHLAVNNKLSADFLSDY